MGGGLLFSRVPPLRIRFGGKVVVAGAATSGNLLGALTGTWRTLTVLPSLASAPAISLTISSSVPTLYTSNSVFSSGMVHRTLSRLAPDATAAVTAAVTSR